MFRRVWASERKDLPLKDVAAVGGWRDTSTLLRYQQPDARTMRAVVDLERHQRHPTRQTEPRVTHTVTHTSPANRQSATPDNPASRFELPLLGSNQDFPDPEVPL
jgi:hypothetical protein